MGARPQETPRGWHPSVFLVLILPFGMSSGYVSGVLGHLARRSGMEVDAIAALVASTTFVHMFKFAWAPLVDTTLTRKAWYWVGSAMMAAGYLGMALIPVTRDNALALTLVITASSVGSTILGMALESIMAYAVTGSAKGRAAGWFQAGNLGGSYLTAGLGLWLTRSLPEHWMAALVIAVLSLACGLLLGLFADVPAHKTGLGVGDTLRQVGREVGQLLTSTTGIVGVVMFLAPIGTGAASGLFVALAADWHASVETAEWANGWAGAPVVIIGCLVGGWLSDRMPRARAYLVSCLTMVLAAAAMALFARTPAMYVTWVLVYTFTAGLAYGSYGGFVLDASGIGAVATKYNVLASFANAPIWYMTRLDGWAGKRWDSGGMLLFEAALGVAGCLLVAALLAVMRSRTARRPATI